MNRSLSTSVALVLLLAGLLLPRPTVAQPGTYDQLLAYSPPPVTGSWDDLGPRTDGTYVVWVEHPIDPRPPESRYSVLAWAGIELPQRREIKRSASDAEGGSGFVAYLSPEVEDGTVVWIEQTGADYTGLTTDRFELHTTTISEWQEVTIATAEPGTKICNPGVFGSTVVWVEVGEQTTRVVTRDRKAEQPLTVVLETATIPELHGCYPYAIDDDQLYMIAASDLGTLELMAVPPGGDQEAIPVADASEAIIARGSLTVNDATAYYRVVNDPDDIASPTVRVRSVELWSGVTRDLILDLPHTSLTNPNVSEGGSTTLLANDQYLFASFNTGDPPGSNCCRVRLFAHDLRHDVTFEMMRDQNLSIDVEGDALVWHSGHGFGGFNYYAGRVSWHLPTTPVAGTGTGDGWFPETHHSMLEGFLAYWRQQGGLQVFGYPLTEGYLERNADSQQWLTTQFTERQRFESHPTLAGTPYAIQLGRLGAELLASQGRNWEELPAGDPASPHYFPETGHGVPDQFYAYWAGHGLDFGDPGVSFRESLALFGYPLSEPMVETNADGDTVLTQYFERAVFEYHPDNPPEWQVLLRRLGAEMLAARGW
ncbi:MAG TPA: hypothetical protein VFV93_03795 [Thermomicrobiales bacterium]|nr:hypothetical protein [Thermomicrobiales bacterium]